MKSSSCLSNSRKTVMVGWLARTVDMEWPLLKIHDICNLF